MTPEYDIISAWLNIIMPYITDKAILGALSITWILVYYIKPYLRKISDIHRRSIIRFMSFVSCGALILWWKADDPFVYETAFILGIANPLIYMFFVNKILKKFWPEAAELLKNRNNKVVNVLKNDDGSVKITDELGDTLIIDKNDLDNSKTN